MDELRKAQPLYGIRVLDFGQAYAAPCAARLLADMGADVVKVEPPSGDFCRLSGRVEGDSAVFLGLNRGKRSISLDLTTDKGRAVAIDLIKKADVLVENFRVGVLDKMGLGYEATKKVNPRLIYCSIFSYGRTGPWVRRRGGDPWAQAISGIVASMGVKGQPPQMIGHSVIDFSIGAMTAFAIMNALFQRQITGKGTRVGTNLIHTALFLQEGAFHDYTVDDVLHVKWGRGLRGLFPFGPYPAKDGDVLTIYGQDDVEWADVCSILGIEHLLADERYDTLEKRIARKPELYPILDEAFRKKTREEWKDAFRARNYRCEPCLNYQELMATEQFQANDMLLDVDHPTEGKLRLLASPAQVGENFEWRGDTRHPPLIGEHSREVLKEAGYAPAKIEALIAEGVVVEPDPGSIKLRGRDKSMRAATQVSDKSRMQAQTRAQASQEQKKK